MAYSDEAVQYVNRYYFRTKTEGDDHYGVIVNIMYLMGTLPFALWTGLIILSIFMFHKVNDLLQKLSSTEITKDSGPNEIKGEWKIDETSLLGLSICLNFVLSIFHIISAVEIIKYGNDVLQSDQGFSSGKNHAIAPIVTVTISIIIIVVTYISAVGISVYIFCKRDPNSIKTTVTSLAAISIIVNITHLLCYFMPYMLLAFIYNPLQTFVTYLALGLYVLCGYLLFWMSKRIFTYYRDPDKDNFFKEYTRVPNKSRCIYLAYFLMSLGILSVTVYFSTVIIYVLTLGSFDDFEVIQNLLPPLLIGILTYFVVKPTYKQAKQKFNLLDVSR